MVCTFKCKKKTCDTHNYDARGQLYLRPLKYNHLCHLKSLAFALKCVYNVGVFKKNLKLFLLLKAIYDIDDLTLLT